MLPRPRLADIAGLVKRAGESGLRVELRVDGKLRPLPDAVELAGYRVVQEGLTNAIRYAAGAAATVNLAYREDGIMVEVTDDGPGAAAGAAALGGGTGLAGLRERARLLGGQLEAGAAAGQGFVVRAFLPGPP
jgi:signal transduction histidine kinase